MATDATGTPTAKGIPKYNTAADAPSGLGFNAAMDSIDTLLDSYVPKPSGLAATEVPVWNGSAWVRSSVTRIGVGSLGSGTPDSTKFLRGDGTWQVVSSTTMGTALPGSPADGDHFILVDSTTAPTYSWLLRYVSAKASNKWIFIGGTPIEAEVAATETTNSASYVALTTAGPNITLPVAGDYFVETGFTSTTTNRGAWMSYDIGATGAVDADVVLGAANNVGDGLSVYRTKKKTGLTAVTLTSKYKCDSGPTDTAYFGNRWMAVTPIAIGG